MIITQCDVCDESWTGRRPEHCPACHKTFGGTTAGDRHRVGEFGKNRRCLTAVECESAGLVARVDRATGATIWGRESPSASVWRHG